MSDGSCQAVTVESMQRTQSRVAVAVTLAVLIVAGGLWWFLAGRTDGLLGATDGGPLQEVPRHGFSATIAPGVPFTDAAEILELDGDESATLVGVESPNEDGDLEQLGFMLAGPGRRAANVFGILEGWPAKRPFLPNPPVAGEGARIAPLSAGGDGPVGSLLMVGYQLAPGAEVVVRPEMIVRYEVGGRTYERRREARMVICNADMFNEDQCERKADELFPEG